MTIEPTRAPADGSVIAAAVRATVAARQCVALTAVLRQLRVDGQPDAADEIVDEIAKLTAEAIRANGSDPETLGRAFDLIDHAREAHDAR